MVPSYRRHDISESVWESLEPLLLGSKGTWGGNARDNRQFINAVFWILPTGVPWRDLPPNYGELEEYAPPVLPIERQRNLGANSGGVDR